MLLASKINDFDNLSFFVFQPVSSRVDLLRIQTPEVLVRRRPKFLLGFRKRVVVVVATVAAVAASAAGAQFAPK